MSREAGFDSLLTDQSLQPPMANGEVVFQEPWQGRVFAMARTLAEDGHYTWDEFRAHLIARIGEWDRSAESDDPQVGYHYYDHFLVAFQDLLTEKGLLDLGALEAQIEALRARPHDHDH